MGYYMARRRFIDFAIRHDDGIKEMAAKIKEKCVSVIEDVKNAPGIGRKIAVVLTKIAKLAAMIYSGKNVIEAVKALKGVKEGALDPIMNEVDGAFMRGPGAQQEYWGTNGKSVPNWGGALKAGLKVIAGLITALAATALEHAAKA